MIKKLTVLITLILCFTFLIGTTKIYSVPAQTPFTSNNKLYYELDGDTLIIGGTGDYDINCSHELRHVMADFTEIKFANDARINFVHSNYEENEEDHDGLFSFFAIDHKLTSFIIDEDTNINCDYFKDMSYFLADQEFLVNLDLSGLDTSNVTDMTGAFFGCTSMEEYHLSNFDTHNVKNIDAMFFETNASIIDISGWNLTNATSDAAYIFNSDSYYRLDLLDLSNCDLSNTNSNFALTTLLAALTADKIIIPKKVSSYITSAPFLPKYTYYCYDRKGNYLNKTADHLISTSENNYKDVYYISTEIPNAARKLTKITATMSNTNIPENIQVSNDMVDVRAYYDNDTNEKVTNFTVTTMKTSGNNGKAIVEYTEGNITKTKYIDITFTAAAPVLSKIEAHKTVTHYEHNNDVVLTDITVNAFYSNDLETPHPVTTFTTKRTNNTITVSYTDTGITKTATITLSIDDLILDITAYKDEEDYEYASDVELDDITVYLNYANGTRIKLDKKDSEHPDGYTVTYDPDDDEEEIVIKYKKDGVTYTDYIYLDIDEFDDDDEDNRYLKKIVATKDKTEYYSDEKVEYDDIKVKAYYYTSKKDDYLDEDDYKVSINSSKTKITVKYTYKGETCTDTITLKRKSGTSTNNTYVTYPKKTLRLYIGTTTAYVNDIYNGLDVAPEVKNDRTYLPIRFVAEALGAKVYWYASNPKEVIIVSTTGNRITLHIGEAVAQVNNYQVPLEDAPYIKNDRTYLPVRFVSEQLGATVNWNALNPNEITIIQNY